MPDFDKFFLIPVNIFFSICSCLCVKLLRLNAKLNFEEHSFLLLVINSLATDMIDSFFDPIGSSANISTILIVPPSFFKE